MDNISVKKGDVVDPTTEIGHASNVHNLYDAQGEKIDMSPHLHFENYYFFQGKMYKIDLYSWLQFNSILES